MPTHEIGDPRAGLFEVHKALGEKLRSILVIGIKGLAAYAQSKRRVVAQAAAVVAIVVAGGDLIDALFEDVVQSMGNIARMPGLADRGTHAFGQADLMVNALE